MRLLAVFLMLTACSSPSPDGEKDGKSRAGDPMEQAMLEMEARLPPPEAYTRPEDQERARRNDPGDIPCSFVVTEGGTEAISGLPTDQCYRMRPRQLYGGLWRNAFEGSRFCPAPARECSYDTPGLKIWLSLGDGLPQQRMEGRGGLYAIEFEGRITAYRGDYGHLGMDDHEIIVDRVVSIREVEPPPPEPPG